MTNLEGKEKAAFEEIMLALGKRSDERLTKTDTMNFSTHSLHSSLSDELKRREDVLSRVYDSMKKTGLIVRGNDPGTYKTTPEFYEKLKMVREKEVF